MRGQQSSPELDPGFYGLLPEDLNRQILPGTLGGCSLPTPRRVIERMRETYASLVGVHFMH